MFITESGGASGLGGSCTHVLSLSILAKILEVILKSFQIELLEYKKINR